MIKTNQYILFLFLLGFSSMIYSQSYQDSIKTGKCYIKTFTPDKYEVKTSQIEIAPPREKIQIEPAKYKEIIKKVLIKSAYNSIRDTKKNNWVTDTVYYASKESSIRYEYIPAIFSTKNQIIETKPATAEWGMSDAAPDCASSNPNDCRYWCYKNVPAQTVELKIKTLVKDAVFKKETVKEKLDFYIRERLVNPQDTSSFDIPAQYKEIRILVVESQPVINVLEFPAVTKTVKKEILKEKGGVLKWKEVDCSVLNSDLFGINRDYYNKTAPTEKSKIKIVNLNKCDFEDFLRDFLDNDYRHLTIENNYYSLKFVDKIETSLYTDYVCEVYAIDLSEDNFIWLDVKYFVSRSKNLNHVGPSSYRGTGFNSLRKELKKCVNGK